MPGLFGGVASPEESYSTLRRRYSDAWDGACDEYTGQRSVLGGHAFGDRTALWSDCGPFAVAVDGDGRSYEALQRWMDEEGTPLFDIRGGRLRLAPTLNGNVAALERETGVLHLGRDWSGAFPLYYARHGSGVLFANLLGSLARALGARPDRLGTLQFLRQGYVYGNRTPFEGVYRVRPGEVLRFDPATERLELEDRGRLWAGELIRGSEDLLDACLEQLLRSVSESLAQAESAALMMSGGWDSRTLLAAATAIQEDAGAPAVTGYSHGDVASRELDLATRLCESAGVDCQVEPLGTHMLHPEPIRRGYERTGVAVFPHWLHAGSRLASAGMDVAASGIFGEVLGGHYGPTMAATGVGKIGALGREWLGAGKEQPEGDDRVQSALALLGIEDVQEESHWYLDDAFEASIPQASDRIREDLKSELTRLARRGIDDASRLAEALITEHRGSQYIAAQAVGMRSCVDVALPFAGQEFLHLASRISPTAKLHNSLNRRIVRKLAPDLLRYPMAATLVAASAPMILQEVSRGVRRLWEAAGWRAYFVSNLRIGPPNLGWVNFEFLRDGRALNRLVDDLGADIWDPAQMHRRIEEIADLERTERLHPYFDQLGKIMTVDLMLCDATHG